MSFLISLNPTTPHGLHMGTEYEGHACVMQADRDTCRYYTSYPRTNRPIASTIGTGAAMSFGDIHHLHVGIIVGLRVREGH
jgi:hypothetical protein